MAIHTAHILGAGAWLGTLTTLVGRAGGRSIRRCDVRSSAPSPAWRLPRAAVLGAAGSSPAGGTWGAVANLWTTAYGRVLLLKVTLVARRGGVRIRQHAGDRVGPDRAGDGRRSSS